MTTVLVQVLLIVVLFAAFADRAQGARVFTWWEWIVFALAVAGAVAAVVLLASGTLTR